MYNQNNYSNNSNTRFCQTCGAAMGSNDSFCMKCGTPAADTQYQQGTTLLFDNQKQYDTTQIPDYNYQQDTTQIPDYNYQQDTTQIPDYNYQQDTAQYPDYNYRQDFDSMPFYGDQLQQEKKKKPVVLIAVLAAVFVLAGAFVAAWFLDLLPFLSAPGNNDDTGANIERPYNPGDSSTSDPDDGIIYIPAQPTPTPIPDSSDQKQDNNDTADGLTPTPTPDPDDNNGYTTIDNPRIVITTRYNPSRGEFGSQETHALSITMAGGVPIQANDDRLLADILRTGNTGNADAIAALYDGLILTGGGDISARLFGQTPHPASETPDEIRDIAEIALYHAFVNAGKPVLGINRGMQLINVAAGGDLIQDIPDLMGIDSDVHSGNTTHVSELMRGSWLYDMFGNSLTTSSNHHQAIGILASGFIIAAQTGPVVEAIENGNILGVQFNPERTGDNVAALIYADFVQRCSIVPLR